MAKYVLTYVKKEKIQLSNLQVIIRYQGGFCMYDKVSGGKRIKKLRDDLGKTQQQVADDVGISVDTIRKLEQGKRVPSVDVVCLLSKYFSTTADYIILGSTQIQEKRKDIFEAIPEHKRVIIERILLDIQELVV